MARAQRLAGSTPTTSLHRFQPGLPVQSLAALARPHASVTPELPQVRRLHHTCMRVVKTAALVVVLGLLLGLVSCMSCTTKQDPNKLREKTAETTANLKQDAKAVAQGIREGWTRDHRLDVNTATAKQIATLPGITPRTASRMVENRPYASTEELVTKHVLSRAEYRRIADRISVKK